MVEIPLGDATARQSSDADGIRVRDGSDLDLELFLGEVRRRRTLRVVGGTVVESHGPEQALALAEVVCGLYRAVFELPPFDGTKEEFAGQRKYYRELTRRPGFRLVTARGGGEIVAFGYGFLLPVGSRWWEGLADPVDETFSAETGSRTFIVIDYGVLPSWRRKGIGRAVLDTLLAGSGAERAALAVQPKAVETVAIYRHWGWRVVSHKTMDPPVPFPLFKILVLEKMPTMSSDIKH